jgi:hypothetical protein
VVAIAAGIGAPGSLERGDERVFFVRVKALAYAILGIRFEDWFNHHFRRGLRCDLPFGGRRAAFPVFQVTNFNGRIDFLDHLAFCVHPRNEVILKSVNQLFSIKQTTKLSRCLQEAISRAGQPSVCQSQGRAEGINSPALKGCLQDLW